MVWSTARAHRAHAESASANVITRHEGEPIAIRIRELREFLRYRSPRLIYLTFEKHFIEKAVS